MSGTSRHIALNCTAYDLLPSGARMRAVGLAGGLLAEGARVTAYVSGAVTLLPDIAREVGVTPGALAADPAFAEVPTPLDAARPIVRATRSERWFRRHLPDGIDLFVTDYYPVVDRVRTALTIHDLRYIASPADEPRHRVVWFRTSYARTAARAPVVIVPSAAIGSEAVFHLGIEAARVVVVPNGLGRPWCDAAPRPEVPEHLVWIGTAEKRKRLALLLRAYAIAAGEEPLLPLVLCGRGGREEALPPPGRTLVKQGLVQALGVVPEAELVDVVRRAAALCHPSRYEGFGMPVLEALALGTPVIAADIPAIREVARGGALLVPGVDLRTWTRVLREAGGLDRCVVAPSRGAVAAARGTTWRAAARSLLRV